MPGRKPSKDEKDQIRDLISKGSTLPDLRARYSDVNGQSLAGMVRRYGPDGAAPALFAPRAPSASGFSSIPPASIPQVSVPPASLPMASGTPPPPQDRGIPPPILEDASRTGFTPVSSRPNMPGGQGLTPGYAENFIVKKVDAPNDGVIKTERPPFGIQELMDRYQPGEYEIMHYRNGNLYQVYRDKVAPRTAAQFPINRDSPGSNGANANPGDTFIKAIDIYHRMHSDSRRDTAAAEAVVAQASVAKEAAKAQVEGTAMTGLMAIVQEVVKPKPEPPRPEPIEKGMVDKMIVMMTEERKTAELKHQHEMEALGKKADIERERDRARLDADQKRFKDEMDSRERMQREFLLKMKEVDDKRAELTKETNAQQLDETKNMYSSLKEQWEERRRFLDEMEKDRRNHLAEFEKISRTSGAGNSEIETAKIIKDAVVGGLDRIGARFDMAVNNGLLSGGKGNGKVPQIVGRIPGNKNEPPVSENPTPEKGVEKVSIKDMIAEAAKSEWFLELKGEIFMTIAKRLKIEANPDLDLKVKAASKPNGSVLAQAFIDKINEDPSLRKYAPYFIAHDWFSQEVEGQKINGVYDDVLETLTDAEKKIFSNPETGKWWAEFDQVLAISWNQSMGVTS